MKVKQNPGLFCKAAPGLSGLRGSSDCQGAEFAQSLVNLLLPKSAHTLPSPPEQTGRAQGDIQRVSIPPGTPGLGKTLVCKAFLRLIT